MKGRVHMKRRLKIGLSLFLARGILTSSGVAMSGGASELPPSHQVELVTLDSYIPFSVPALEGVDNISTKQALIIDGVQNNLYCTFDDANAACEDIVNKIPGLLNKVQSEYGLSELTPATVEQYNEKIIEYWQSLIDDGNEDVLGEYSDSHFSWICFKQIFDSYKENDEIVSNSFGSSMTRSSTSRAAVDESTLQKIGMLLPYTTPLAVQVDQQTQLQKQISTRTTVNGFNVENGTAYAKKHATDPNKADYKYFSNGDCTNFVSQILENGGIKQEVYDDENLGWWHKKSTFLFITTHKQSLSWVSASTFARYMGRSYPTTDFSAFSKKVQPGDFIAMDSTGKGNYHHMGYVTAVGSNVTQNGITYRNFQVAQHTNNYLAWCDTSTNGWDTGHGSTMYCIVRRAVS